jgi:hypothetical protein
MIYRISQLTDGFKFNLLKLVNSQFISVLTLLIFIMICYSGMGKEVLNMSLSEESESAVISSGTDDTDLHLNGTKELTVEENFVEEAEGPAPKEPASNGDCLVRASGDDENIDDGNMTPDRNVLQSKSPSRDAQVIFFSFFVILRKPTSED